MKINFTAILLLIGIVFPLIAKAQTDSSETLKNLRSPRKKGIYRTYEEFRNNSPSIPYEGKVEYMGLYTGTFSEESDFKQYKLKFGKNIPCANKTPIWGFSDGSNVYKARGEKFKKSMIYDKIIYNGRYAYFKSTYNKHSVIKSISIEGERTIDVENANKYPSSNVQNTSDIAPKSSGISLNTTSIIEYGIDINTGTVFKLTYSKLKEILAGDPELLEKFEEDNKAFKFKGDYLMKYSEKHLEEIK